jgi:hypothetical protein
VRAGVSHRLNIQHALISLFETPVPENDPAGRAVLTRILGKQDIDFDKPIIDILSNPHLSGLARAGVKPVVWESKEKHEAGSRTVLDPIGITGQEPLLDFIGDFRYPCIDTVCPWTHHGIWECTSMSMYVMLYTSISYDIPVCTYHNYFISVCTSMSYYIPV